MKLLIVDDEPDLRDTMREFFADEGFAVEVASDGHEAMAQLATIDHTCAVILDIMMPGMDGVEVWNAMQRDPRLVKVPVVMTTSDPSRAPHGVPTLRKPVDLEQLLSTVETLCERITGRPC